MPTFTRTDSTATCDPRHLAQLLSVESVDIEQEKVHVHGDPPPNAQQVIDSYVYDPDWNLPPQAKRRKELAKKPTLTNQEIQEALKLLLGAS